jgi:hypothetical protein
LCAGNAPESRVGPHIIARRYTYVSKSVLIEITRLPTEPEQLALGERVKQGATVRAVRQKKQSDPHYPCAAEKMLAAGRSFARQLRRATANDIAANRDHYEALVALRDEIDTLIEGLTKY